ncbi:MAG TPA: AAA family ATPase [Steroidobacteraceae bacterium]|nr:AAA family ATPase [Steroidobacteraceae bacterium]
MYLDLFKLRDLPFRLSPDPQYLYLSRNHSRAKAYMESTIWFTDGFVVITGEIGSGKTTLIETFLRELEQDVVVAQVNQTQVSAIEFLQAVLVQFGFSPFKMKKAELLATLNQFLIEQYAAGRKVLLIVDEAQNLSLRVLEEIRLLSGVETAREKVLRIILAGQPELNDKLDSRELVQLAQRVRLRFHLTALSQEDTRQYVLHRLEVAGAGGREIFAPETFPEIYRFTGGTPRLVNTLCDTAMMGAYAADQDTVTREDILNAVEELQWAEYASRTHRELRSMTGAGRAGERALENTGSRRSDVILAHVTLASEDTVLAEVPLRPGRVIIGRTSDNDIQVDSRFVSRHHCQIVTTAESCVIEDLNSTNGMSVRGKRVRRHVLSDGDIVMLGQHSLTYRDDRVAQAARPNDTGRLELSQS